MEVRKDQSRLPRGDGVGAKTRVQRRTHIDIYMDTQPQLYTHTHTFIRCASFISVYQIDQPRFCPPEAIREDIYLTYYAVSLNLEPCC